MREDDEQTVFSVLVSVIFIIILIVHFFVSIVMTFLLSVTKGSRVDNGDPTLFWLHVASQFYELSYSRVIQ